MEWFKECLDSFFCQIMEDWSRGFNEESVTYANITYKAPDLKEVTERYRINVLLDRVDIEKRIKDCCNFLCKNEGIGIEAIKDIHLSYTG